MKRSYEFKLRSEPSSEQLAMLGRTAHLPVWTPDSVAPHLRTLAQRVVRKPFDRLPSGRRHGTWSAYVSDKCRCPKCKEASRLVSAKRRVEAAERKKRAGLA